MTRQPEPCEICDDPEPCECEPDWEEEYLGYPVCSQCGGTGEYVPEHCCVCGGSPYCVCCRTCGASCIGNCKCPVTVQLSDGEAKVL